MIFGLMVFCVFLKKEVVKIVKKVRYKFLTWTLMQVNECMAYPTTVPLVWNLLSGL